MPKPAQTALPAVDIAALAQTLVAAWTPMLRRPKPRDIEDDDYARTYDAMLARAVAYNPHATTRTTKQGTTVRVRRKGGGQQRLVFLRDYNPYKKNTKAHATWEMFRTCETVAQARAKAEAAGGNGKLGLYDIQYLHYATRDGYMKLEG